MHKIAKTHIHKMSWVRPSTDVLKMFFFLIQTFYHKLDIQSLTFMHKIAKTHIHRMSWVRPSTITLGLPQRGENGGGRGPKMVEMVMGAVGVTKCHTSLQLLCLLQSVTLCHTITLGLPQRGENGGKGA